MAVALESPTNIFPVKGVRLAAKSAGIYARKRNDLSIIEIAEGSVVSAVFTKNRFCAAPVIVAKKHLNIESPRFLLINAGNANAGTGNEGLINATRSCKGLAEIGNCKIEQVLPFSTGVIGEHLPADKIINTLPEIYKELSSDNWLDIANAIMTTDTLPKAVSKKINIGKEKVTITGIAKGAGMIRPDMATMLSFIATDINISKDLLDKSLTKVVNKSFNRITIDGDTSTNDACVLIATGKANNKKIDNEASSAYEYFYNALLEVLSYLAQAIVRDGEGATKFVQIDVTGGRSAEDCLLVAYKIGQSPLVKTALTASDPNWGRILAAIGCAGVQKLDINKVGVWLGDVCVIENGQRANSYSEEQGKEEFLKEEITISANLGMGDFKETIWTTDLSYDYIKINAEYRT